jgi:uncharacterized protein
MKKTCISADQLLRESFSLAVLILQSGFRPDIVVGVWRGGTPIAIAVHEAFQYAGHDCRHLPIQASSYKGINIRDSVKVAGLEGLLANITNGTKILLVDDVFDSGQSMAKVLDEILLLSSGHMPETRIAVPWYKPAHNTTNRIPDYYLYETSDWLVFPHELCGLDEDDILRKPGLGSMAEALLKLGSNKRNSGI